MLVLVLVVALMTPARSRDAAPFVFQVPDGWTDLSSDVPESELPLLPEELLAMRASVPVFAMDIARAGDGFGENMNVVFVDARGRITQDVVDATAQSLVANGIAPGTEVRIVSAELKPIGGVDCGRVETMVSGAMSLRQVAWLVPGKDRAAVITYSATPETFAEYVATFDASARATKGVFGPTAAADADGRGRGKRK